MKAMSLLRSDVSALESSLLTSLKFFLRIISLVAISEKAYTYRQYEVTNANHEEKGCDGDNE